MSTKENCVDGSILERPPLHHFHLILLHKPADYPLAMANKDEITKSLTASLESLEAMLHLFKETSLSEDQSAYMDLIDQSMRAVRASWQELRELDTPVEKRRATLDRTSFHVLLADDDAVQQVFAVRALEKHGYKITTVKNGQDALRLFAKQHFDLILMDCQMPVLDGFETTKHIRILEKKLGTRIPIVAYTAHSLVGYKQRCLQVGMDDYLKKPVSSEALVTHIKRYKDARDASSPKL
jgi:CheY-like chemotaxis protein